MGQRFGTERPSLVASTCRSLGRIPIAWESVWSWLAGLRNRYQIGHLPRAKGMRTRIHGRDMGTHAPSDPKERLFLGLYAQPIQVNWPSRTVALDVELVRHNIF